MNDNGTKRSLRTSAILMAVAAIAAVALTYWTCRHTGRTNERALFWGIVLPWSIVARVPGAFAGNFLGHVARHAVGWFAAVIAGMATILIFNYVQEPDFLRMIVRLRTGLIPPAVIFGILAATITEASLSMLEILGRSFAKPQRFPGNG